MILLVLDAAHHPSATIVANGLITSTRTLETDRGQSAALAPMAAAVLQNNHPDAVVVTLGPGSFTGLRAAIALAHGIAAARAIPLVGVTLPEAFAAMLDDLRGRRLWVAIDSRRDRIFLHRENDLASVALDALPPANGPIALAGNAAVAVASILEARGDDVWLTDARHAHPLAVAAVGRLRLHGALPAIPALPLYIDAPEAKLPAGGLRPAPQG